MTKFKKIIKFLAVLVVILTLLSIFGSTVKRSVLNESDLGYFKKPLEIFVSFPETVITVLKSDEIKGIPPTFQKKDSLFKQINKLQTDIYGLNSFYKPKDNKWEIKLFNFKNDSVIHKWELVKESYFKTNRNFQNSEPRNCILLKDREIIMGCDESKNLYRLDKNSNIIWHNTDKEIHHSLNMDIDGNILVCTYGDRHFKCSAFNGTLSFKDNFITKYDVNTGEIIYDKSITDILKDNGFINFVYGFSNHTALRNDFDPLHLNDIEPVLSDGEFWEKGDLFLSLRHRSLIIQYRPDSDKIIRLIYGPFLNQHDIDILSNNEISIFNNNTTVFGKTHDIENLNREKQSQDELLYSEIIIYNLKDSSFRKHIEHQFIDNNIFTETQGFHQFLNEGDVYIENQNNGKIYILNNNEVLLQKQFETDLTDMVERPHWIRIYEDINF